MSEWTEGDIRYSLNAAFDAGQLGHPQLVMREAGIVWERSEPQPIADQWLFRGCRTQDGKPITLAPYMDKIPAQ